MPHGVRGDLGGSIPVHRRFDEALARQPQIGIVRRGVAVTLATHDADGVTELDVELATFMNAAAS